MNKHPNYIVQTRGADEQSNQVVFVEAPSELMSWRPLVKTLSGHPFPFTDPTSQTHSRRFYRAQAQ